MKQISDKGQVPPGGWSYTEPLTGVKFTSNHYLALMQSIRKHWEANDFEITGEWQAMIQDLICQQNPMVGCNEIGTPERTFTSDDIKRFILTMNELRKDGELVSEDEQRRRLTICGTCPKKGVIACSGCGWLAGKITELLGDRKLHRPDEFFKTSCLACGCDLSAKSAIPLPVLRQVDEKLGVTPDYSAQCWMRE